MRELQGVRIVLARRKQIGLLAETADWIYHVQSGCLTVDANLAGERRQVMLILYPGDTISREAVPPIPNVLLTAMLTSTLVRAPQTNGERAPAVSRSQAIMQVMARSSLHGIMIGRLTSEERLSSLLIEMALFLGKPTTDGWTFELPLTRNDMADYLALNPDTLSRLMTRLRTRDIISLPSRHRVIIKSIAALAELSPISDVLCQIRANTIEATNTSA